jgi:hypothetical protein
MDVPSAREARFTVHFDVEETWRAGILRPPWP